MTDGFKGYLRNLDKDFPINEILTTTISVHGRKFMERNNFKFVREIENGYREMILNRKDLEKLIY